MHDDSASTVDDASSIWLQVIGAVDYLSQHHRPGLTVWDAVEEAVRWWTADFATPPGGTDPIDTPALPWSDPDPLRTTLERLFATVGPSGLPDGHATDHVLDGALTVWLQYMSNTFNDGHLFAHPRPRAGWPPLHSPTEVS